AEAARRTGSRGGAVERQLERLEDLADAFGQAAGEPVDEGRQPGEGRPFECATLPRRRATGVSS
ncbi:hypothetical protein, partial [Streptomyces sp. NPDC060187]|uniref:hypothetical protein n=1 Tax=Streptomyces sp. NPDC060187 TaxID=3347067 RepID=UPI00365EF885